MCMPPLWPKRIVSTNRPRRLPRDVIDDLSQHPKRLSPKYFYDAAGSELFEQITLLPEYYPTRTELGILRDRGSGDRGDHPARRRAGRIRRRRDHQGPAAAERMRLRRLRSRGYFRRLPESTGRRAAQGFPRPRRLSGRGGFHRAVRLARRRRRRCRRSDFSRDRRSEISSRMKPARSCAARAKFSGKARRCDRRRSRKGRARAVRRL